MSAVRRVVIVGRDAELWLSALAIQRALGPAGVITEVIELPSQLSVNDCYSAAPSLTGLHDLLGLNRRELLRVSRGLPVTGQRFSGWNETPFCYGYDAKRAAIANVDILQYWIKARTEGLTLPLDRLSVAAVAAGLGRVGPDGQSPADFGTIHRGYHLDGQSYAGALRILARQRGIPSRQVDKIEVRGTGDRIDSLRLHDGGEVSADLFIDASGSDALLCAGRSGDRWESWVGPLPADRMILSSAPPLNPAPPFADIRATAAGWVGLFPLAGRTAVMGTYSSTEWQDSEIAPVLAAIARTDQLTSPEIRHLRPGMRPPWTGNVVAVGTAAVALPPLDLMQLHIAHVGITNLITLFPANHDAMPEAKSYNTVVGRYAENVRDIMAAHYRLNTRFGETLWDRVRTRPGPASLDARLALFAARGIVPSMDDDSFDEGLWSNLLVGHGLIPRGYDPKIEGFPREEVVSGFQRLIDVVEEKALAMPTVAAYLGQ